MEGPPASVTQIGYYRWCQDGKDAGKDHYVLPNGGAKIVYRLGKELIEEETFAPGTWEPLYPEISFGSYGGVWIERKRN